MRIVWCFSTLQYCVLDLNHKLLFASPNMVDCEDYLLGRNMRSIYAPD